MIYSIKEYEFSFKTPAKKQQERVIVDKIFDLLNENKYDSFEEFISRNKDYQNFLKNANMENVVKHFGNALNEQDFLNIINNIKLLIDKKKDFEKENIEITKIDNKEFNSLKGDDKSYFIDNSNSNKTIEEQMKDVQNSSPDFQTSDIKQNTENLFKELEQNKKESFNLLFLNEINKDKLNNEELLFFNAAINYQLSMQEPIRVDLQRGIIVDKYDNIKKIEVNDGELVIKGDNNQIEENKTDNIKAPQKQLGAMPNQATIYSNN